MQATRHDARPYPLRPDGLAIGARDNADTRQVQTVNVKL